MAGDSAAKRGRLFDLFVNQPGHQDLTRGTIFWCPLCRKPFSREHVVGDPPALTLGHIVQECLGGTWKTLCCRWCNNGNGHEIERDFLASHRVTDWAQGCGKIDVRMGEGGRVKAEMRRDPTTDRIDIRIITPMANPAVPAQRVMLEELLKNPESGNSFSVTMPWFRPNWCKATICQSAYLLMFKYFGYDFARCGTYNVIRDQVLEPDTEQPGLKILVVPPEIADQFLEGQQAAVIFVREPMRAILAVMRFRSPGKIDQVLAVVMPGPGEPPLTTIDLKNAVYAPVADETEKTWQWQTTFVAEWHHWLHGVRDGSGSSAPPPEWLAHLSRTG